MCICHWWNQLGNRIRNPVQNSDSKDLNSRPWKVETWDWTPHLAIHFDKTTYRSPRAHVYLIWVAVFTNPIHNHVWWWISQVLPPVPKTLYAVLNLTSRIKKIKNQNSSRTPWNEQKQKQTLDFRIRYQHIHQSSWSH